MTIIKQLSDDTFDGSVEGINNFFAYRQNQIESSPTPSLESSAIGGFIKKLTRTITGQSLGQYTPRYIKPINVTEDWLAVGEVVVEIPVTFRTSNVSMFFGQLDHARPAILALEHNIDQFTVTLGKYISDPSLLASLSGVKEVVNLKDIEIKSLESLKRMVDIDAPSRTKLSRLFTSVSDLKLSVDLCNKVSESLSNVDIVYLKGRVDRIVELIEILDNDSKGVPSKNSLSSLTKDTHKLAVALSELAYIITAVDNVSIMMDEISKSLK